SLVLSDEMVFFPSSTQSRISATPGLYGEDVGRVLNPFRARLLDGAFDLGLIARHVRRDLDVRQRRAQLAFGLGVESGLVERHGVVVVVLLLALADGAGALEGANGRGEVARAVRPLGRATSPRSEEH